MPAIDKSALRASARAARAAMSDDERRAASARIVARLERLPELRRARTVLLYAAAGQEADPSGILPWLLAREVRTLFPRVRDDHLELVAASDLRMLQLGYRGIAEPVGVAVDPAVVDLAIVPGTAFDLQGGRLGQGGGHYDRLLAALPATTRRIGVCFASQVVTHVPREPHDAAVDLVVTDRIAHRVVAGG